MKHLVLLSLFGATLFAEQASAPAAVAPLQASAAAPAVPNGRERYEMAVSWVQTSGEWRALYYQGYQLARLRLDAALAVSRTKPPAVVLDIDETVLDNSAYHARALLSPSDAIPTWAEWIDRAEAVPVPGALEFLRYAAAKGVAIYYVTNRTVREKPPTLVNLRKHDFPMADVEHVVERTAEASKEPRRAAIAAKYDILLLLGDNLNDFAEFNALPLQERNAMAERFREEFGGRFIVFPNPINGDWESALYVGKAKPTDAERRELRLAPLRPYR